MAGQRLMVHLAATYPDGAVGWVVCPYVVDFDFEHFLTGFLAMDLISDLIDYAVAYYHQQVGPAYSLDDFTFTIWPFESVEEMFYACGPRLMATDDHVANYQRPIIAG